MAEDTWAVPLKGQLDKTDTKGQQLPTPCVFQQTTLGLKYQSRLQSTSFKSYCLMRGVKSKLMLLTTQNILPAAAFVCLMFHVAKAFCFPCNMCKRLILLQPEQTSDRWVPMKHSTDALASKKTAQLFLRGYSCKTSYWLQMERGQMS